MARYRAGDFTPDPQDPDPRVHEAESRARRRSRRGMGMLSPRKSTSEILGSVEQDELLNQRHRYGMNNRRMRKQVFDDADLGMYMYFHQYIYLF